MKNLKGKRYWLIGASDGIGYELAKKMDNLGASLIISARDTQRLNALSEKLLIPTQVVYCDVTDSESIRNAYDTIGPIDGVVYMAGEYTPMHSQNWVDQDVIRMADTNFLGALRVLGACMPSFVSRDNGHIVIVGSLANEPTITICPLSLLTKLGMHAPKTLSAPKKFVSAILMTS